MEILEIMEKRHSVRQYLDKRIEDDKRLIIDHMVKNINDETGFHFQVFYDEPKCFNSIMAKYGRFKNANNYISLVGRKSSDFEERIGYYGEKLVLSLTEIGLESCWVALTHGKSQAVIDKGEKELIIIAFGHGVNEGVPHKSKSMADLCEYSFDLPDWFIDGMKGVILAPTALNQQKFYVEFNGGDVKIVSKGGHYSQVDLGIVKLHFELASSHIPE